MSDSTSISSLTTNNVSLTTTEKQPVQTNNETQLDNPSSQMAQGMTELSSKTINDIVSGIQNAAQNGMTSLQSRDIPTTTPHITQDPEVKPNYIPQPQNTNYIEQHDSYQSLIDQNSSSEKISKIDSIYDEIQTPLMAMVMFFFFQMPYFTKLMGSQMPSLFSKEGFPTLTGNLFKASLFGFAFYGITKISNYLSNM
jgi:hypothetical protein